MSAVAAADQRSFTVAAADVGQTLPSLLRRRGLCESWSEARRLVETGKIAVDGTTVTDAVLRPSAGSLVSYAPRAPRLAPPPPGRIVFEDGQVVLLDKPAGVASVPYEDKETGTAMDLVRAHWRSQKRPATEGALHIVHRIDKDTSGLLLFARTSAAERALAARFRQHDIERTYLCVVHGHLTDRRIESRLVEDRGDGLRGSTRHPGQGKRAITHVRALEPVGPEAMLCEVRLETGKTHQIRIHLAENGHPLVGERVYLRDYTRDGHEMLPAPRLLLHAATLGFAHPQSGEVLRFSSDPPPEFAQAVAALRRR